MADDDIEMKNINDLSENSSVNNSDNLMVGNAGTNSLRRLSLSNLFDAIKSRMTSWTFSGFNTSNKTITGAVNEVRSTANGRVKASDFVIETFNVSSISCDSGSSVDIEIDAEKSGYKLLAAWFRGATERRLLCVSIRVRTSTSKIQLVLHVLAASASVTRDEINVQALYVKE